MNKGPMIESLEVRTLLSAALMAATQSDGPAAPVATTTAAPRVAGVVLTEPAGVSFTAKLGTFTFKTIDQSLTAEINWGDGKRSRGTIEGSYATGKWYVEGTHQYAEAGTFNVHVRVFAGIIGSPIHGTSPIATFTSFVKVLKPTEGGRVLTEPAGKTFTARIGEFEFRTVDQLLSAVINWGDGTKSAGKLIGSYATGEYYVQGTHNYAHAGTFKVDVVINARLAGGPNLPEFPVRRFTSVIQAVGKTDLPLP